MSDESEGAKKDWENTQKELFDWFFTPTTTDEERTLYVMELDLIAGAKRPGSPFDRSKPQE